MHRYPRIPVRSQTRTETALLDVQFADLGAAVAQAGAEVGAAVAEATVHRDQFVQATESTVAKTLLFGEHVRRIWDTLFVSSKSGVIERTRALRGDFLQRLGQSLGLMRFALDLAARAAALVGTPLPGVARLAQGVADLETIQREALSQWGVSADMAARLAAMTDVPLKLDKHGDIRVGKSRVLLDTILEHHKAGMPPEEIARAYDTLQPADVYETIAYYLRHTDDVEAYLQRRNAEGEALRQEIEGSQPSQEDLKARIKERWSRRKADHAAPAD